MTPRCLAPAALLLALGILAGCRPEDSPPLVDPVPTEDDAGTPVEMDAAKRQKLHLMHERTTQVFVKQPLFGGGRMHTRYILDADIHFPPEVLGRFQESPPPAGSGFARGPLLPPRAPETSSSNSPLAVERSGWPTLYSSVTFQERLKAQHVTDTLAYESDASWVLETVQLVGLVKHPEPTVYLSDAEPNPEGPNDLPTRAVDGFERRGLAKLRAGEALHVEKLASGSVRMVGPIFAGKRCLDCHETPGQMLGAFSYTFAVGPPVPFVSVGTLIQPGAKP